jgi:hypothetical protein
MRILCPMCGFGREIDQAKIPARAQMATCPRCQHKFRFRVVDDLTPAEPLPAAPRPGPFSTLRGGPDPLAAQRASAEQAWKHLQGVKPEGAQPDSPKPEAAPTFQPGQEPAEPAPQPEPWSAHSAPDSTGSPVPFEELPRHGFFPGLWSTITAVLKTPTAFFRSMPVSGGMATPLIFHLLLAEFMVLCQYAWGLLGLGAAAQFLGSTELMDLGIGAAGPTLLMLLVYPLLLVLRLMFMTGIIHLLLRAIFRFTGGPGSGAEATFRVLCYSAAPLLLGVVPFLGPLLGGAWSIGLTIIGLREAHRTRGSAATFAVLLPILLLLAAALGLMQAGMKG